MTTNNKLYALIGAGPSGLSAARNLKKYNIQFDGYESSHDIGGLWDIKNPTSTIYESAHLISSKKMTEFVEFPMDESYPDYPNHKKIKKYFDDYAKHFNLYSKFKFNSTITNIEKKLDKWEIEINGKEIKIYDGVIIANGTLAKPNIPLFKGTFSGEILHSSIYKSPEIFKNKNVLLVGAGNSGCDIAVDAIGFAKSIDLSVRRGYHFIPKYIMGKPADTFGGLIQKPIRLKQLLDSFILKIFTGDPSRFGFPKPDHLIYQTHPVVNSLILHHLGHGDVSIKKPIQRFEDKKVFFTDGSFKEYDLILLCTGYKLNYSFINPHELNWVNNAPKLFLNIFHPNSSNIFILGMVEATGLGWEGRNEQAELLSLYLKNLDNKKLSSTKFSQEKLKLTLDLSGGYKYLDKDHMSYYVHKNTYRNIMVQFIKELKSI